MDFRNILSTGFILRDCQYIKKLSLKRDITFEKGNLTKYITKQTLDQRENEDISVITRGKLGLAESIFSFSIVQPYGTIKNLALN